MAPGLRLLLRTFALQSPPEILWIGLRIGHFHAALTIKYTNSLSAWPYRGQGFVLSRSQRQILPIGLKLLELISGLDGGEDVDM